MNISNDKNSGLVIQDLSKTWGHNKVLQDFNLVLPRGRILGITGDNGAGKSTLLKILASVTLPDSGTISFDNLDISDLSRWRALVAYVPQELALDEKLTVKDNIKLWSALAGESRSEIKNTVKKAASDPLVADFFHKELRKCSGGMARRASVLVGLLGEPQLILLDEPFAGTDKESKNIIIEKIYTLRDRDCAILIASHELATLEEICDRILFL